MDILNRPRELQPFGARMTATKERKSKKKVMMADEVDRCSDAMPGLEVEDHVCYVNSSGMDGWVVEDWFLAGKKIYRSQCN